MLESREEFAFKALEKFITTNCFAVRPSNNLITLASKAQSNVYFDLKPALCDPSTLNKIAILITEALEASPPVDYICGPELGGVPLAIAVGQYTFQERQIAMRPILVRKAAKDHGNSKLVQGLRKGETIEGKSVAVIEDVTTTGGSAMKIIESIRSAGGHVPHVITVVNRDEGAAELFAQQGMKFTALTHKYRYITPEQEIYIPTPQTIERA